MSLVLKKTNPTEYEVLNGEEALGKIRIWDNPFHATNCYVGFELIRYDVSLAKELFAILIEDAGRPLQAMISSEENEKRFFLEEGGFVRKRKCFEAEVSEADLIESPHEKNELQSCVRGTLKYDVCCKMLYDYYGMTHKQISPLTAAYSDFVRDLPSKVFYQSRNDEVINIAFVEMDELAYVASKDEKEFKSFISAVVSEMFRKYDSIVFECDDCDTCAMELFSLFHHSEMESYDTYIRSV